jgi:3-methyladenine DNA glycosylase/8-oxoguanine DNA glycosylase
MSVLNFRWPIDLALTVASHGWVQLAPWRWDPEAGRLARVERIEDHCGNVEVVQSTSCAVLITCEGSGDADGTEILARVGRWLSADWEPASAIAALPDAAALIGRGGGRMLRGSCFYEDFVKTLLTINANWSATCRMAAALVSEPGEGAFPTPRRCSSMVRSGCASEAARFPCPLGNRRDAPHARRRRNNRRW